MRDQLGCVYPWACALCVRCVCACVTTAVCVCAYPYTCVCVRVCVPSWSDRLQGRPGLLDIYPLMEIYVRILASDDSHEQQCSVSTGSDYSQVLFSRIDNIVCVYSHPSCLEENVYKGFFFLQKPVTLSQLCHTHHSSVTTFFRFIRMRCLNIV